MKRNLSAGLNDFKGAGLDLYSEDSLKQLHLATIEVLSEVGLQVGSRDALECFEKGGCIVDYDEEMVRIPQYVVEEAIQSCPATFTLYGKSEEFNINLQDGRVYHSPFGCAPQIEDLETGEIRPSVKADIIDAATLVDQLPEYDFCFSTLTASDAKQGFGNIHSFEMHYTHCRKPILSSSSRKWTVEYDIQMASVERGSLKALQEKPTIMFGECTISPLFIPAEACEVLMTAAEYDIPVANMTMSMAGGMAPVTLAGSAIIANAENLACLVLSQLVRKGARFVCGGSPGIADMRHGANASVGCPEAGLLSATMAALGRMYGIPTLIGGT
jgi:Trimethylamine:corrinoid methyltransferase